MIDDYAMNCKAHDRLAELAADIGSPRVIPAIDKAMGDAAQEWLDLFDLRKMAVRRHGELTPAPTPPFAAAEATANVIPADQAVRKNNDVADIASLIARYKADERSTYKGLRFRTREHYDSLLRRVLADCPTNQLVDWKATNIKELYAGWTESGGAIAHALIGMLRILFNYGATTLENRECDRLSTALHRMRFPKVKSVKEPLSDAMVIAIRTKAREMGFPSIALAQAFQYECRLGQRDVIGEWVPEEEPGKSDLHHAGLKWLRGIRWEEIGRDFILRHPTSRDGSKVLKIRLEKFQMVREELAQFYEKQGTTGPMIVSEAAGLPFEAWHFRHQWRLIARAAGVPDNVKNMASKTVKRSEQTEATGDDEHMSDPAEPQGEWTNQWDIPAGAKPQ